MVVFPGGDEGCSSDAPRPPRVFGNPWGNGLAALGCALLRRCGVHHRGPLSVPRTVHGDRTTRSRPCLVRPCCAPALRESRARPPDGARGRANAAPAHGPVRVSEVRAHGTGMASVNSTESRLRASTSTHEGRTRQHVVELCGGIARADLQPTPLAETPPADTFRAGAPKLQVWLRWGDQVSRSKRELPPAAGGPPTPPGGDREQKTREWSGSCDGGGKADGAVTWTLAEPWVSWEAGSEGAARIGCAIARTVGSKQRGRDNLLGHLPRVLRVRQRTCYASA